jgi:hypothetical protein
MISQHLRYFGFVFPLILFAFSNAAAEERLTLDLYASAKQQISSEPLYVAIALTNAAQSDFDLWEPFSSEYGDVKLYARKADGTGFWDEIVLDPNAGRANDRRLRPKTLRPGDRVEVIEAVVPAAHLPIRKNSRISLQAHFVRKGGASIVSNAVDVALEAAQGEQPGVVELISKLLDAPFDPKLELEKNKALEDSAHELRALSRALAVIKRCRTVAEFSASRNRIAEIQELAKFLETLPVIEREFWAIEVGEFHMVEAGRLVNRRDSVPAEVTFHLDIGAALDKSLGTTAEKAQWVRKTTDIYRKRLSESLPIPQDNADMRRVPEP